MLGLVVLLGVRGIILSHSVLLKQPVGENVQSELRHFHVRFRMVGFCRQLVFILLSRNVSGLCGVPVKPSNYYQSGTLVLVFVLDTGLRYCCMHHANCNLNGGNG